MSPDLDALAAEFGGQRAAPVGNPNLDALAAEFGGQPAAAPQPKIRMDRQKFNAELLRRARETDEAPAEIKAWAESVLQPERENAADLNYGLGPDFEKEITTLRAQPNVPANIVDAGVKNTGAGTMFRGAVDELLFNRGDEAAANLRTGFGLAGDYDAALLDERVARAQDDPTDRFFGQMGMAALEMGAGAGVANAAAKLVQAGKSPGALRIADKILNTVPDWVAGGGTLTRRAGRGIVAGGGAGALYSSGALTGEETLPEAATKVGQGTLQGAAIAGPTSVATDIGSAITRKIGDLFSGRSGATSALAEIGKDFQKAYPEDFAAYQAANGKAPTFPELMRFRFDNLQQQLGRQPNMAEVMGPQGSRLTDTLAAAPENAARFQQALTEGADTMRQGVRQRRGTRDYEAEQEQVALAGVRQRVGEGEVIDELDQQLLAGNRALLGDAQFAERQRQALLTSLRQNLPANLPQRELDAMQAGVEQQVAGLDSRGPLALRQAQKELDDANYAALREVSTPVDPKDVTPVNNFLASVSIEARTKAEIRKMLNDSKMITGDAYEKIRRGLRDRWLGGQIGSDTYRADAEKLDNIFGPYLPQVGEARRASFEARSATEGSALGMKAIGSGGQNKPATMTEALDVATPEQMAGAPSGAVQEIGNQTRTADSTYQLAEQVVSNRQYAANLKRVLPGGMADGLISFLTNSKRAVDRASDLAMDKATANGKAAYDFAERLADPRVAQEFRAAAPDIADGIIADAARQKAAVDALEGLNLPKAVESVAGARQFSDRVVGDANLRGELRARLPGGIGNAIVDLMTTTGTQARRLEEAGLRTAGDDTAKAYRFLGRIATDAKFAAGIVRDMPRGGQELVDFARSQKANVDRAKALGLNKVAEDAGQSYRFAERLRDPDYEAAIRRDAPDIADDLISFAKGQKQAIDSLAGLTNLRPDQVATAVDSLEEAARAGFFTTSGGVAKAGFLTRLGRETWGIGKDAARKLADDLLDPAKFEPAMRLLEKRGITRDRLNRIARDSIIAAFSGNNEMPEGTVSVAQPQE